MEFNKRAIFVDDEPNILSGYKRGLRNRFPMDIANSPELALEMLAKKQCYSVIISDYMMPNMNGAQFLEESKKIAPDAVRVLLTGQADFKGAINCVNKGEIFRFLTKPCGNEQMVQMLHACQQQYELVLGEQILLERTLKGAMKVLIDVFSLSNPKAFGYASRVKRYVDFISKQINAPKKWQFTIAAMLSQLGLITLAPEMIEKIFYNTVLTSDELQKVQQAPKVAQEIIKHIPRLEDVAMMIGNFQNSLDDLQMDPELPFEQNELNAIGSQILKVTIDYDRLLSSGVSMEQAIQFMKLKPKVYHPFLVEKLVGVNFTELKNMIKISIGQLKEGMILAKNIISKDGTVLIAKGQETTLAIIARLRNLAKSHGITELEIYNTNPEDQLK